MDSSWPSTPSREFAGWAATNVRETQWHPSQKIVTDDGQTLRATFELGNTVEFKRWLLGFGRQARVLAPQNLVDDIREELQAAAGRYPAADGTMTPLGQLS